MDKLFIIILSIFSISLIIIIIVVFVSRNPIKAALGSLIGLLGISIGSLSSPNIKGTAKFDFSIGTIVNIKEGEFNIDTNTPEYLWVAAFCILAFLIYACIKSLSHTSP